MTRVARWCGGRRSLTPQYVQYEFFFVVMDKGPLGTSGKRTVDIESVVAVTAVTGAVMNRDDIAAGKEPGQQTSQYTGEVFCREVVENLTDDDQVIEVVGKLSVQGNLLHSSTSSLRKWLASFASSSRTW
jgi:hypothetical protein